MLCPLTPNSEILLEDDDISVSADIPTSLSFLINGCRCFVFAEKDDMKAAHIELLRAMTVTHRITTLEPAYGLYRCVMTGSDSSVITFYLGAEDVYHNMVMADDLMGTKFAEMVC